MSLGTKLLEVAKQCRYMKKDGRNSFQNYNYTTAASVLGEVNEAMTTQGLYAETRAELVESRDVTSSKGNNEKFVIVKVSVIVHDADDPKETVTYEGYGSGQDVGDKAVMKANTAAVKYAYVMGLPIAMGNDPEDENNYVYSAPPKNYTSNGNASATKSQNGGKCSNCGKSISDKVANYSQGKYGKPLCYDCQNKSPKLNENSSDAPF